MQLILARWRLSAAWSLLVFSALIFEVILR
jgi:hypothetical protein